MSRCGPWWRGELCITCLHRLVSPGEWWWLSRVHNDRCFHWDTLWSKSYELWSLTALDLNPSSTNS